MDNQRHSRPDLVLLDQRAVVVFIEDAPVHTALDRALEVGEADDKMRRPIGSESRAPLSGRRDTSDSKLQLRVNGLHDEIVVDRTHARRLLDGHANGSFLRVRTHDTP